MVFLPIILLLLGIAFSFSAYKDGNKVKIALSVSFAMAAIGTAFITYFALTALD